MNADQESNTASEGYVTKTGAPCGIASVRRNRADENIKSASRVCSIWPVGILIGFAALVSPVQGQVNDLALLQDSLLAQTISSEKWSASPSAPVAPRPLMLTEVAPDNAWIGATLAYNLQSENSVDNVIGSSRVTIAPVEKFDTTSFNLMVVGNIGQITTVSADSAISSLSSIAQTTQGLSVGIAPIFKFNKHNIDEQFKLFSTLNYRANKYRVGQGDSLVERTLNQARFTLGAEFEGLKVKNGKMFSLTGEAFVSYFDGKAYEDVFGTYNDKIYGAELTLIIPLGGLFGFLINGTYVHGDKPVYQTGLIVAVEGSTNNRH